MTSFAFSAQLHHECAIVEKLRKTTPEELRERLEKVKAVREWYTYPGVVKQIEMFLADPLGTNGGQLRCQHVPNTDHRRLQLEAPEEYIFERLEDE